MVAVNSSSNAYKDIEAIRETERNQQLYIIKKERAKAHILRHDKIVIAGIVITAFVLAFIFISIEAKITAYGYQVTELKEQIQDIENQSDRLDLEIASLNSLSRIENYALTKLNMVYPEINNIGYLDISGSVAVAESSGNNKSDASAQTATGDSSAHPFWTAIGNLFSQYLEGSAKALEG